MSYVRRKAGKSPPLDVREFSLDASQEEAQPQRHMKNFLLQSLVLTACLGAIAEAQTQVTPFPGTGNVNVINDLAGGQSWFGTSGDDTYRDNIGGAQGVPDVDIQHDGPMSNTGNPWDNCADGASDILETSDGDNNDTMIGGREDFFVGDNGDTVVIVEPDPVNGGVREVWRGT